MKTTNRLLAGLVVIILCLACFACDAQTHTEEGRAATAFLEQYYATPPDSFYQEDATMMERVMDALTRIQPLTTAWLYERLENNMLPYENAKYLAERGAVEVTPSIKLKKQILTGSEKTQYDYQAALSIQNADGETSEIVLCGIIVVDVEDGKLLASGLAEYGPIS